MGRETTDKLGKAQVLSLTNIMSRTVVLQGVKCHPHRQLFTTDLPSTAERGGNSDFLAQPAVTTANPQTMEPESLFEGSNYTFCREVRQKGMIWREPALSWGLKSELQDATGLLIHLAHMEHLYSFPIHCFYNIYALKLGNTTFCNCSVTVSVADPGWQLAHRCCTEVKPSRSF